MVVDWTEEMKAAFVRQQFEAQHVWYQEHYQGATFDVILVDGAPPAGSTSTAGRTRSGWWTSPSSRSSVGVGSEVPSCAICWRRGRPRASR